MATVDSIYTQATAFNIAEPRKNLFRGTTGLVAASCALAGAILILIVANNQQLDSVKSPASQDFSSALVAVSE